MKPTSEMTEREAACFVNLKKAMNESQLLLDYLRQAHDAAPNEDVEIRIDTCIYEMTNLAIDIKHAVQSLTN